MFCPKCGKDCGEFKFCPHCGTEVPEAEPAVWSVGMACPHCGGTELKGNNCAFCGALLKEDVPVLQSEDQEWDSYEIPYRKLDWLLGCGIELKQQEMIATTRGMCFPVKKCIPYANIVDAEYKRTAEYKGEMRFRWKSTRKASGMDEITQPFLDEDDGWFCYQVFFVIKMLAPTAASFSIHCPSVDQEKVERFSKIVDLHDLFLRHAPVRVTAAKELGAKCMVPAKEAHRFICDLFDVWQMQTYETEPRYAARDYHRRFRYIHKCYEEKKKKAGK